jgi:hypothetical protein
MMALTLCVAGMRVRALARRARLDVIVKASPAAITPDAGCPHGASRTGCETEFVRVLATGVILLRLWPTRSAPDVQQCLTQLKSVPGVEYAAPDTGLKAS